MSLKTLLLAGMLCTVWTVATAQENNPKYDAALADSLGADEYGMKSYVFVLLKTGEKTEENPEKRAELFRGHMENIGRLAESGELVIAGPMGKNDHAFRGIFILNVDSVEKAEELLQTDPAIAAGLLEPVIVPWYGSAALPAYIDTHRRIEKTAP